MPLSSFLRREITRELDCFKSLRVDSFLSKWSITLILCVHRASLTAEVCKTKTSYVSYMLVFRSGGRAVCQEYRNLQESVEINIEVWHLCGLVLLCKSLSIGWNLNGPSKTFPRYWSAPALMQLAVCRKPGLVVPPWLDMGSEFWFMSISGYIVYFVGQLWLWWESSCSGRADLCSRGRSVFSVGCWLEFVLAVH